VTSPSITIVVLTHNRAHLVSRALRSVLAQSDGDFSLLVIDDASADETQSVLTLFSKDPRVRLLINGTCKGTLATRNRAIGEVSSEWIVFLDDDDELLPKYVERLRALIATRPELGLVWSGAERAFAGDPGRNDTLVWHESWDGVQSSQHEGLLQFSTCWGVAARREALLSAGLFDVHTAGVGDIDLALRMVAQGTPYATLPEPLVRVHVGADLSVTRCRHHHASQRKLLLRKNAAFLAEHPKLEAHYRRHAMSGCYRDGDKSGARRMAASLLRSGRLGSRGVEMLLRFEVIEPIKRLALRPRR